MWAAQYCSVLLYGWLIILGYVVYNFICKNPKVCSDQKTSGYTETKHVSLELVSVVSTFIMYKSVIYPEILHIDLRNV